MSLACKVAGFLFFFFFLFQLSLCCSCWTSCQSASLLGRGNATSPLAPKSIPLLVSLTAFSLTPLSPNTVSHSEHPLTCWHSQILNVIEIFISLQIYIKLCLALPIIVLNELMSDYNWQVGYVKTSCLQWRQCLLPCLYVMRLLS